MKVADWLDTGRLSRGKGSGENRRGEGYSDVVPSDVGR
jgi:hypothetical protein